PGASCGKGDVGPPFDVGRGKRRIKAVVARLPDLTAVVTLDGTALVWTDSPAPDGGPAIFPESKKGETTFCAFLTSTKAWTRLGWGAEAEGYAPIDGRCGR